MNMEERLSNLESVVAESNKALGTLLFRDIYNKFRMMLMWDAASQFGVDAGSMNLKKRGNITAWEDRLLGSGKVSEDFKQAIRLSRKLYKEKSLHNCEDSQFELDLTAQLNVFNYDPAMKEGVTRMIDCLRLAKKTKTSKPAEDQKNQDAKQSTEHEDHQPTEDKNETPQPEQDTATPPTDIPKEEKQKKKRKAEREHRKEKKKSKVAAQ